MQPELDAAAPPVEIELLGVNRIGSETGNASITSGRTLPWLQDTQQQDVWVDWQVTYRDVVILDEENRRIGVFNLTEHDLADTAQYAALKTMLLEAAEP